MSNIKSWSLVPASNNAAPPQGAPEGMAPSTVNDIIRQQMADHRAQWEDAQWFDYGFSISYTSATVLRFNQTSQAALTHTNRRIKAGVGAGVIYGSILSTSVTSSDTVFTVTWDSGSADASLSYVELGITTFTNSALPAVTPSYMRVLPAGIGPLPYAGSSIPSGWLYCDGSAISRTTYAALFTAISTTWGVGDGVATFNLPDMRGRTIIGDGTGTVAESVTDANVSVASDTFTVTSNATKWITGQAVVLTTTTTLPTGLSLATTYYVVRASATTIQFATSLANAQNGTIINITAVFGSGTHTVTGTLTIRTLGQIGGEEAHAVSSTEMLSHTHPVAVTVFPQGADTGAFRLPIGRVQNNSAGSVSTDASSAVASSTGGNVAANVMPPFVVTKYIISY